jgi:hypothetical protein
MAYDGPIQHTAILFGQASWCEDITSLSQEHDSRVFWTIIDARVKATLREQSS